MINNKVSTFLDVNDYNNSFLVINDSLNELDIIKEDKHKIEELFLNIINKLYVILSVEMKNNKVIIKKDNGLIQLNQNIPYLDTEIEKIASQHAVLLSNLRFIRNKYDHEQHKIRCVNLFVSDGYMNYIHNEIVYKVDYQELKELIIKLNLLFDKIYNDLKIFKRKISESKI